MAEIRDIKPADPLWPKRPVEKTDPETERRPRPQDRKPRKRRDRDDDDSRGRQIDEYV